MKHMIRTHIRKNRLSYTLILYILLSSVVFTFVASVFQLYSAYKGEMDSIEDVMNLIGESYLAPLESSLWSYDMSQLETQVKGILTLPYIVKAEIRDISGIREKTILSIGTIADRGFVEKVYTLSYTGEGTPRVLGTLKVFAGLDSVRSHVWDRALSTFVVKIVEILILFFCILGIFHHVIMKHLSRIAAFLQNVDVDHLDVRLNLDRKPSDRKDILDIVVFSINSIHQYLAADMARRSEVEEQLRKSNEELELSKRGIEEQNRLKTQQVAVSDILREEESLDSLALRLIAYLCDSLGAGVGLFYHVDIHDRLIRPVGAFAMKQDDFIQRTFVVGEGLVGQAVADRQMLMFRNPGESGLSVQSSLGSGEPSHILIFPFEQKGCVTAAVEIGSFQPFSQEMIGLLEQIGERVALATETAVVRSQKAQLIEKLKDKARELDVREQAFRHSEEQFRLLFTHSDHVLITVDSNLLVYDLNPRAQEVAWDTDPRGEALLYSFAWVGGPEENERLKRCLTLSMRGEPHRECFFLKSEQGKVFNFDFVFRPVPGENNTVWKVMMDGVEVTQENKQGPRDLPGQKT